MPRVGLLECPVCEKSCVYRLERIENRETLKQLASVHLETHRLAESKRGIYRVAMAEGFEQVTLEDPRDVSIGRWDVAPIDESGATADADAVLVQPNE